jgi:quercetin dioxygenase-like cupin family protein
MADESVVVKRGEGKALWMVGTLLELKVTREQSNGRFTVGEISIPPGSLGAPPHKHSSGEVLYVIEGMIRHHLGERTMDLQPGSLVHIAGGTWEYFENPGSRPARVLIVWTDPNIERFFAAAAEPAPAHQLPEPAGPPSAEEFERLVTLGQQHGLEIRPVA